MNSVDDLLRAYKRQVATPWERALAPPQRVWIAIYDPALERRMRPRAGDFELATREAGYRWKLLDLTDAFARWMARQEYREAYFEEPEDMEFALALFKDDLVEQVREALEAADVDQDTIVALAGIGSLFGLTRTSAVIEAAAAAIRGRLLVFFPGHREGSNYRLLDARDGWNYLALPIEAVKES